MLKILFILVGFAIGYTQFGLLRMITASVLSGAFKLGKMLISIGLKILIYAVAIVIMLKIFRAFIVFAGGGLAAGLILGAVIFAIRNMERSR